MDDDRELDIEADDVAVDDEDEADDEEAFPGDDFDEEEVPSSGFRDE